MELIKTNFDNLYIVENNKSFDIRGGFIKMYNKDEYLKKGINLSFEETYYTLSNKNVVRGMHFQTPPYECAKLVNVIKGSIIDVVIDLRKNSKTYKKVFSIKLDDQSRNGLLIPIGFAHGFKSLEDDTIMLYQVQKGYNRECDQGISFNSIDYDWDIDNPITSDRDKTFVNLDEFDSPF